MKKAVNIVGTLVVIKVAFVLCVWLKCEHIVIKSNHNGNLIARSQRWWALNEGRVHVC